MAESMISYSKHVTKIKEARLALQNSRRIQQQLWSKPPRATTLYAGSALTPITHGNPSDVFKGKCLSLSGIPVPQTSKYPKISSISSSSKISLNLERTDRIDRLRNGIGVKLNSKNDFGKFNVDRRSEKTIVPPLKSEFTTESPSSDELKYIKNNRNISNISQVTNMTSFHAGLPWQMTREASYNEVKPKIYLHVSLPSMIDETTEKESNTEETNATQYMHPPNNVQDDKDKEIDADNTDNNKLTKPELDASLKDDFERPFWKEIPPKEILAEEIANTTEQLQQENMKSQELPVLEIQLSRKSDEARSDRCRACPACIAEGQRTSFNENSDVFRKRFKVKRKNDIQLTKKDLRLDKISYHKSFKVSSRSSQDSMQQILKNALNQLSKERQRKDLENVDVRERRRMALRRISQKKTTIAKDDGKFGPRRVLCRHGKFISECCTCSAVEEVRRRLKVDIEEARGEYDWKFTRSILSNRWRSSQNLLNPLGIDEVLNDVKRKEKGKLASKTVHFSERNIIHPLVSRGGDQLV
ncbi:uncharacterized protein [Apostichopus japonicus]|uniref:uncharacterized protein n=1 Tax=Stichopus japonicus TaxID=307972 RepID=UPI003AB69761